MSGDILTEIRLLLDAVVYGAILSVAYDVLRIFRRVIPHKRWLVDAEDFLFWTAAGLTVFSMLYTENDGVIRGFILVGMILGAWMYHEGVSKYFVKYTSNILKKLLKPFTMLIRKLRKAVGKMEWRHEKKKEELK